GPDRRRERPRQHPPLEGEGDDAGALGEDAARSCKEVRDGDAQRLDDEGEDDHPSPPRRAPLSRRCTSGTLVATAMITTAVSTSTICLGTTAFTASPPCDSVAKRSAAITTPPGWSRPTRATAIPRKPAPAANPSS